MIYGILLISILVLVGGAIAYIGDNVGRRVGKRRITMFGLRPKHTSIIVTIITGFLITAFTFGALFTTSAWVRQAFFGLEELKNKYKDIQSKHSEMQSKLKQTSEKIARTEKQIAEKSNEIDALKKTAEETRKGVVELEKQRDDLMEKKAELEKEVEQTALRLGQASKTCLYGEIIFKRDQALARLVITEGASEQVVKKQLDAVIGKLYAAAKKRGAVRGEGLESLFKHQKNELIKTLAAMGGGVVIEIHSATNVLEGEPLIPRLALVENKLVIKKGEVLEKILVEDGLKRTEVEKLLEKAMQGASANAHEKGMVPDMETGDVSMVFSRKLSDVVKKLMSSGQDVSVSIVAKKDTRIADRLEVDFELKRK